LNSGAPTPQTPSPTIQILNAAQEDVFVRLGRRSTFQDEHTERIVREIIDDVTKRGDAALLDNARRFDAPELQSIVVTQEEIESAELPEAHVAALQEAAARITAFHSTQVVELLRCKAGLMANHEGVVPDGQDAELADYYQYWFMPRKLGRIGQRLLPLNSAGVYVPGGAAAYPSSVLMNALPASIAGVRTIVATTPARRDGTLPPAVLWALKTSQHAFKIGGAAAIAAMALGTESVPKVDKIVGPGNRFVNEAKRQLWGQVGLDGYAGPSEVCVLVDDTANPAFAAADLLTQIEHAPDNAGFLVALSEEMLRKVLAEVERQLLGAPREQTMRAALRDHSLAIVARDLSQACEIVDAIAPEHLTIMTKEPESTMQRIRNAGCILLGDYTPESAADWAIGPSHTLPTAGGARYGSPVNVLDFLKVQSVAHLRKRELESLLPALEALGEMEGFPAHTRGAKIRFESR
jgi:histidinol dehydrogenase